MICFKQVFHVLCDDYYATVSLQSSSLWVLSHSIGIFEILITRIKSLINSVQHHRLAILTQEQSVIDSGLL